MDAYCWLVVDQFVGTGSALGCTPALYVTWTVPLQYAACGAIQVLHAFAYRLLLAVQVRVTVSQMSFDC